MADQNPTPSESLLEFPCRFPIKAMGKQGTGFEQTVSRIIEAHAELWPGEALTRSSSSRGNYVSITAVIEATSQAQLDAIYQDLTDCADVLMAL